MNTTLTPTRHTHPPDTSPVNVPRPVRRVRLLDRIALHVGIALVMWSRRPKTLPPTREARARRIAQELDRAARERGYERHRLDTIVR